MNTELGKRVATGIVGGGALLAVIIYGGWPGMFLVTTILSLGMLYEYALIVLSLPDQAEKKYAILCVGWLSAIANLVAPRSEFEILLVCFLAFFVYALATAARHVEAGTLRAHFQELALAVFGLMYLGQIPFYLTKIHQLAFGVEWTIVFLLIVFAGDTGAYFAGKKYGKTKLYPTISPKKTREGGIGGLIAGYVLAIFSKAVFFREMPWLALVFTPLLVGATAQVGDFCESLVKRAYDKKDSGSILPGHGGFLDRFDGVVFSLPVMYACVRLFGL